jgi:hypothetical protein
LPEFLAGYQLARPFQQREEHLERVVFDVEWEAPFVELPFRAVYFEQSETDSA